MENQLHTRLACLGPRRAFRFTESGDSGGVIRCRIPHMILPHMTVVFHTYSVYRVRRLWRWIQTSQSKPKEQAAQPRWATQGLAQRAKLQRKGAVEQRVAKHRCKRARAAMPNLRTHEGGVRLATNPSLTNLENCRISTQWLPTVQLNSAQGGAFQWWMKLTAP